MTGFPQLVLGFEAIGLEGHGTPFGVVVDIDEEGLKVRTKSTDQQIINGITCDLVCCSLPIHGVQTRS